MKAEKIFLPLAQFPEQIRTYLEGANFYDSSSHSGACVFYVDTGYYLKIDQKGQLAQEATLAKWFENQGLGVPVIHYLTEDKDYLLTKEAEGKDALACSNSQKNFAKRWLPRSKNFIASNPSISQLNIVSSTIKK